VSAPALDDQSTVCAEIESRLRAARGAMVAKGYSALIVYGNNKLVGSLRYLTGFFPDRAGWISLGRDEIFLFEGAALVLPIDHEPVLLVEPGLTLAQEPCISDVRVGSFTSSSSQGLTPRNLAGVLKDASVSGTVGIETWEKFPVPLWLELTRQFPGVRFEHSVIVEELRLVKSAYEIEILKRAALVGDLGHQTFVEALRSGIGKSELELVRIAEYAMRAADPIYEDSCTNSPSLICSGTKIGGNLLHAPQQKKTIKSGDIVHWDICTRHLGYDIDTSRTRSVGKPAPDHARAYQVTLDIMNEVVKVAKPGRPAASLVDLAEKVAGGAGFTVWERFLGHGLGLDAHERPDMGAEGTPLAKNMVLAIEPRIVTDDGYLVGNENMVLVENSGGTILNKFPMTPLEL